MFKQSDFPNVPHAEAHPESLRHLGVERQDPYFYLRDKSNPSVIGYLEAENAYTEEVMQESKELQEQLYNEILSRIKEDDQSYPTLRRGYYYYTCTEKGKQYPTHYRYEEEAFNREWSEKPHEVTGGELLFDVNQMAEGKSAFIFAGYAVSPDNKLAAYFSNDTGSYAEFSLRIRDIKSGRDLPLQLEGVSSLAWAEDSETIYYSLIDETLRSSRIFAQRLTDPEPTLVYEELDTRFSCSVSETKTREFIFITTSSSTTSEEYYLWSSGEDREPKLFLPRERDVRYSILTHKDRFYIYYRDKEHLNGMVYTAPQAHVSDRLSWTLLVPHREDVRLDSIGVYEDYIALEERRNGLTEIRILTSLAEECGKIHFPEPVYTISLRGNSHYDATTIRYVYSSMNRPASLYEYDLTKGTSRLLKEQEVGGGFSPEDYIVERQWAEAEDGTRVPIALLYRRDLVLDGSAPTLLYGYGSYGIAMDAHFSVSILSLVDRGFVYALAQVRGGSDLGEAWYEEGKFLKKRNTFTDFIACAEALIQKGYTSPSRLMAMGGSAGGLLIGAVVNMRPDLFHAAVAQVPFMDVVTTMLDDTLPLTTGEYEEWGNPNEEEYFHYMLSYSPYDNLRAQDYPHLLVTGGLNDSQVLFHEPAKYVAKLRSLKTDDHILLLHMNMDSGHGGATGRYDGIRDTAFAYAFLISSL